MHRSARLGRVALRALAGGLACAAVAGCSGAGSPRAAGATGSQGARGSAATSTAPPHSGTSVRPRSAPARVTATLAGWRLPAPLSRLVAAPTGTSGVLLIGGLLPGDRTVGTVYDANVGTGHVTRAGTLAEPVHDAAVAAVGGTPTVFGGGAASEVSAVQQLRSGAGGGWTARVVGRLPQARSDVSATVLGRTAYLIGGYDGSSQLADVLATTDGRQFRRVGELRLAVRYAAVVAAGGSVWVLGGEHNGSPVATVQRFDPATGRVSLAGRLPEPLGESVALDLGGIVLLAGGRDVGGPSAAVWRFDPSRVRFTRAATLRVPVAMPGAAVVGGRGWLFGGEAPDGHTTVVQNLQLDR